MAPAASEQDVEEKSSSGQHVEEPILGELSTLGGSREVDEMKQGTVHELSVTDGAAEMDLGRLEEETVTVSSASSGPLCRICQEEDTSDNPLGQTGCACRGSVQMAHSSCLLRWVSAQRSLRCELCHSVFGSLDYQRLLEARRRHVWDREGTNLTRLWDSEEDRLMVSPPVCGNFSRLWFVSIFIMLVFALSSSVAQLVLLRQNQQQQLQISRQHQPHEQHLQQPNLPDHSSTLSTYHGPSRETGHQTQKGPPQSLLSSSTPATFYIDFYHRLDHPSPLLEKLEEEEGEEDPVLLDGGSDLPPEETRVNDDDGVEDEAVMAHRLNLSAAVLVVTVLVTVGVFLLWMVAEFFIWPLEYQVRSTMRSIPFEQLLASHLPEADARA